MDQKVNLFIDKSTKWKAEYEALRSIALECKLEETFKWMHPCYTLNGKNVILIHGFKAYCAILFFKGVLLKDAKGVLIQSTENVQAGRQFRFNNLQDIIKQKTAIKSYIKEAIELEKAGIKPVLKEKGDIVIPIELQNTFKKNPKLKKAFEALTPGRQRAYILFFDAAKQVSTKETRIEKCTDRILKGFGLNDCTCGHSKRMPNCDGSHKFASNQL
jgi:uncharacterized protein YdeI (YjbR/CyaY-like superfamily)